MSKELNCMNCCIGDFKQSLCDCNNGICKECKKVGRAEDFENEVLNRTKTKTGWIPVSERLPEISGLYLVSTDRYGVWATRTDVFDAETNSWAKEGDKRATINAWMPLPEPYREDGEE